MNKVNAVQKAFLSQYISLILIILSFMIGASATHQEVQEPVAPVAPVGESPKVVSVPNYLSSQLVLENVFANNCDSINTENLEPLKEFLLNHNLDVHLTIAAQDRVAAKVVSLASTLNQHGFWKDSFSVSGHLDPSASSTKLTASFEWNKS